MATNMPPRSNKGKALPELPRIEGRFYGLFMNAKTLDAITKPVAAKFVFMAHNAFIKTKANLSMAEWTYLLTSGGMNDFSITVDNKTYMALSDREDLQAMYELFGVNLKDCNRADQVVSDAAILKLLKSYDTTTFNNYDSIHDIDDEVWKTFHTALTQRANNTTIAGKAISLMLTVLYSICRTGAPSATTIKNLAEEMGDIRGVEINIDETLVKKYWSFMGSQYDRDDIRKVMHVLLEHFQDKSIRLRNLVEFAKKRNLTTYYCVLQALTNCATFDWPTIKVLAPQDFDNYARARLAVGDTEYWGYGPLGIAASSNYPTLGYVSIELCRKALNHVTLSSLVSNLKKQVRTLPLDTMIDKYVSDKDTDINPDLLALEKRNMYWFHKILTDRQELSDYIEKMDHLATASTRKRHAAPQDTADAARRPGPDSDDDDNNGPPGPSAGGTGASGLFSTRFAPTTAKRRPEAPASPQIMGPSTITYAKDMAPTHDETIASILGGEDSDQDMDDSEPITIMERPVSPIKIMDITIICPQVMPTQVQVVEAREGKISKVQPNQAPCLVQITDDMQFSSVETAIEDKTIILNEKKQNYDDQTGYRIRFGKASVVVPHHIMEDAVAKLAGKDVLMYKGLFLPIQDLFSPNVYSYLQVAFIRLLSLAVYGTVPESFRESIRNTMAPENLQYLPDIVLPSPEEVVISDKGPSSSKD